MDPATKAHTKKLLLRDYYDSGKDLGSFALDWMEIYNDICYEIKLQNATSQGKKVTGTAILESCEALEDFLYIHQINGRYSVELIDTQKEFFMLLEEIKQDLEKQTNVDYILY